MSWDEFRSLLAGIGPDTVLGRTVAIRSETDKDVIKHFTADQKRIYDEWKRRESKTMSQTTFHKEMDNLEKMLAAMCKQKEVVIN